MTQKGQARELRVLVADPDSKMLRVSYTMFFNLGIRNIASARTSTDVETQIARSRFDAIFLAEGLEPRSTIDIVSKLRHTALALNQTTPVILVSDKADRNFIERARDAGVTEFIRRPVSGAIIQARLDTVLANPRDFVTAGDYAGPDRRRVQRDIEPDQDRRSKQSAKRAG